MNPTPETRPEEPLGNRLQELRENLRKLERRDWWLWVGAIVVMLVLALALFTMTFPGLLKVEDIYFRLNFRQAVRGLVALVLLFNFYTIYQQIMIKRLRHQFSEQLSVMRQLKTRAEEFQKLATVDALTGLYNRRFLEQRLAAETARSERYGRALTLVSLDLDNFKHINDTYGHPAGDQVLKDFAERLRKAIRVSDLAARIGGDEFVLLLPECPPERVRSLLARLAPLETNYQGHKIPVTFSAGWVGYQAGESPQEFLGRADETLYTEKRAGKATAGQAPAAS